MIIISWFLVIVGSIYLGNGFFVTEELLSIIFGGFLFISGWIVMFIYYLTAYIENMDNRNIEALNEVINGLGEIGRLL